MVAPVEVSIFSGPDLLHYCGGILIVRLNLNIIYVYPYICFPQSSPLINPPLSLPSMSCHPLSISPSFSQYRFIIFSLHLCLSRFINVPLSSSPLPPPSFSPSISPSHSLSLSVSLLLFYFNSCFPNDLLSHLHYSSHSRTCIIPSHIHMVFFQAVVILYVSVPAGCYQTTPREQFSLCCGLSQQSY